jgi:hypothetical protein
VICLVRTAISARDVARYTALAALEKDAIARERYVAMASRAQRKLDATL